MNMGGGGSASDFLARTGEYKCVQCFDAGMLGGMSGHGTIWCSCAKGRDGRETQASMIAARAIYLASRSGPAKE